MNEYMGAEHGMFTRIQKDWKPNGLEKPNVGESFDEERNRIERLDSQGLLDELANKYNRGKPVSANDSDHIQETDDLTDFQQDLLRRYGR